MSIENRQKALVHIQAAFTHGAQTQEQRDAVFHVVKPIQNNFCLRVFDAVGLTEFPECPIEKREKATEILKDYLAKGGAPEGIINYATRFTGHHITLAAQFRINEAFA